MSTLQVRAAGGGAAVPVRLRPRSSRRGVGGVREGALVLKVTSPPVEGKANEEARRLLADLLGIAPSRIALTAGAKSRGKVFGVKGMTPGEVKKALDSRCETK